MHTYDDTDLYWWKQFEERYALIMEYWGKKDNSYLICNVSNKRANNSKVRIWNFVKMPGLWSYFQIIINFWVEKDTNLRTFAGPTISYGIKSRVPETDER